MNYALTMRRGVTAAHMLGLLAAVAFIAAPAAAGEIGPSFRNDVMAVIAKAGCNAGACHGNKSGKAGFKLSLRGQDPDADYLVLTRDLFARRTNPIEPDQSLILLKATAQVPHEGGQRFKKESEEYAILRRWIEAGVPRDGEATPQVARLEVIPSQAVLVEPADSVRLKTTAVFTDGSRRDVSRMAVYDQSSELAEISVDGLAKRKRTGETTVIVRYLQCQEPVRVTFVPARPGFAWKDVPASNYIDDAVFAKLRTLRMNPSGLCGDSEFVRRAYLDLLGLLPTAEVARAFVADTQLDKRARLVDALLERPEYADFWALKRADLLRIEERSLDRKGVQAFHHWIRQSIAENKPLDQFVRELIAARGSTYTNPPTNYYRANRDAVSRAVATAEVFLGTRLQCAQCHNHPFDRWTQDDYYSWAAVFARVDYKIIENKRRDKNDKHEFVGEQVVFTSDKGNVTNDRTGKPADPRLLGEAGPAGCFSEDEERLDRAAAWVTSPKNTLFAKAQVNRIWYHLMGRGIVDPIDDFRATNPPSHPELLDRLAADFVAHHFDVKYMIRLVMNSRTYSLSWVPNETNAEDEVNYSHAVPRRLTAEQLLDCEHEVAAVPAEFNGYPVGIRAAQVPGTEAVRSRDQRPASADAFLKSFGKPARELTCECERSSDAGMGQVFQLISGPEITSLLARADNRIGTLVNSGLSNEKVVDELYWTALSRAPTAEELASMTKYIAGAKDRRKAVEDVAWAILNAKEFVLRR